MSLNKNFMKKWAFLIFTIGILMNTYSQNDSIGDYLIYHDSSEYYLIYDADTFWVYQHGIAIKFEDSVSSHTRESFCDDYNLVLLWESSGDYFTYRLSNSSNFINACDSIYYDPLVAELIFGFDVKLHSFIPDDYEVDDQWYLDKLDVYDAWDITFGSEDITVAVIDEGLFLAHDELGYHDDPIENVYHNDPENDWIYWDDPTSGNNTDEDNNDKEDDWKGWNYTNFEATPPPPHFLMDNNVIPEQDWGFHGTAVSGIISAKTNNGDYIAGIAGGNFADDIGGVKILPIKIFDWRLDTYWNIWVQEVNSLMIPPAIDYAVEMGADIISMSWGIEGSYNLQHNIEIALQNAYENGVLLVASVGNEGYSNHIAFPASDENVIAVGATDQDDEHAVFEYGASNCGDEIDLSAPGVEILTLDNEETDEFEGTSFSAPMVAATAALMLSVNPYLQNDDVRDILINTAEKVGSDPYQQNGWNSCHGFGRINTYYAVCAALETLPAITINTNTTWDEPVFSLDDIVVEPGNTLTITSTVYMGSEARFIIKPGAEVIIDEGIITNYKFCGHENLHWPGFQVWGNRNASQYTVPGQTCAQGKLILNGATIENAVTAVDLWKPGENDMTGGIIDATDAIFLNNAKSIHALNYRNFNPYNPNQELDYYGAFKNCTFSLNDQYLSGKTFYKHVDLDRVKGIKFYGCSFSLAPGLEGVSEWNDGIAAYDAGFRVMPVCTSSTIPCQEYDSCRFTGFYNAIKATSESQVVRTFFVNSAVFSNNTYGVHVSRVNNEVVVFSRFNIGNNRSQDLLCCTGAPGTGIYAEHSTGFAFEENTFTKAIGAEEGNNIGIWINTTGAQDEVYKNYFNGLSYANYAEGQNTVSGSSKEGLAYFCNHNTNNIADFFVSDIVPSTIQSTQGGDEQVTGNTFSQSGATWHFYNGGVFHVGYYYCDICPSEDPDDNKIYYVTDKGKDFNNPCPSHYGVHPQKDLVLTGEQKLNTEQLYYDNLLDFNSVKALYDNLIDGGNTEGELLDIQNAEPDDMWALREQLLGDSPHLSMDVLKKAADRTDVFTESALFDILAANPDELKKEELISYLEDKENPLPDYMIAILREVASGTTYKTVLLQQMSYYSQNKTRAAHDIIRSILNDSVTDYNELRNWFDNLGGIRADHQIIATYIEQKNFTDALSLANMLPQLYGLEGDELIEHDFYMEMLNLYQSLYQQARNVFLLDSSEVAELAMIADSSKSIAGAQARNILEAGYGYHFYNCPNLNDTSAYKGGIILAEALNQISDMKISVKPNPAGQWAAFDYILPEGQSIATITITDLAGKTIEVLQVSGQQGQKLWDTRQIKAGVYLYTLKTAGFSKTGKLTINK